MAEAEGGKTAGSNYKFNKSKYFKVKHQSLKCQQKLLRDQEMPTKRNIKEVSNFMAHNTWCQFFYLLHNWKLPSSVKQVEVDPSSLSF